MCCFWSTCLEIYAYMMKHIYGDIGALVCKDSFHPMGIIAGFVQSPADKREWWLEIRYGDKTYWTSINITTWKKFDLKTKAAILNDAREKLQRK